MRGRAERDSENFSKVFLADICDLSALPQNPPLNLPYRSTTAKLCGLRPFAGLSPHDFFLRCRRGHEPSPSSRAPMNPITAPPADLTIQSDVDKMLCWAGVISPAGTGASHT